MLPHPSMSFAWDENIDSPARALLVVFALTFIVLVGAQVFIDLAHSDTPVTVTAHQIGR